MAVLIQKMLLKLDKGINNIICGSYIAKAKNPEKAYFKLVKRVDE